MDPGTTACDGTACRFGGGRRLAEMLREHGPVGGVRCLGHCYATPSFRSGDRVYACPTPMTLESWNASWGEGPEPAEDLRRIPRRAMAAEPVVLRNLLHGRVPAGLAEYDLPAGDEILAALEASGLRGRGGAARTTAATWCTARDTPAPERWVVANGDEGDPGAYVDRLLLEEDPHAVLAGLVACARAIGARRGIVCVRGEYPRARKVVEAALREARAAGKLGKDLELEVRVGSGSFHCGEETALLRALEGQPDEPRTCPPDLAQSGLQGQPTVVHHVETLAMVAWVARTGRAVTTKTISLSGALERPGAVEVPLGTPLRRVLLEAGGGAPAGRPWKMALVGGPLGRVLPESRFEQPLSYERLPGLGHGGVVVLDAAVSAHDVAEHLFEFAAAESCGACAPCREGSRRLGTVRERAALERLLDTMEIGSLCRLGREAPRPIRDLLEHFGPEVLADL